MGGAGRMRSADSQPHYIAPIKGARWPRCFVYLDTEAHRARSPREEEQSWRLGVAAIDRRQPRGVDWEPRAWLETTDRGELWDWVTVNARAGGRTVLICHNLAYDLRIAGMLPELLARGWRLERIALDRDTTWAAWRRGQDELVAIDLFTFLPRSLESVGELLGIAKLPLPADRAPDAVWMARCRGDVEILAAAWRELADWVIGSDLGGFATTGAGMAWQIWRHRFLDCKVLARVEPAVAEACRTAAWTGRAEAWRLGVLPEGRWVEWDYRTAYGQIGYGDQLPARQVDALGPLPVERVAAIAERRAVLAEVLVRTERPVLPAALDGGICWPVGEFGTVCWWGEAADAIRAGARVEVRRAWAWRREPLLHAFMAWCLAYAYERTEDATPLRAALAKHWSRVLVGRMGLRYTDWQRREGYPEPGVWAGRVADHDSGEVRRMLLVGSDWLEEAGRVEGMDAATQVLSYVMSQTRRMLWRAMRVAGLDELAYVDTDGLIVTEDGDRRLAAAGIPGLRRKATYRRLEIIGPRQVIADGELRVAGLPRRATPDGAGGFEAEWWQRLEASLRVGRPDRVRVYRRQVRLTGGRARRAPAGDGRTYPIRVEPGPAGALTVAHPAAGAEPATPNQP